MVKSRRHNIHKASGQKNKERIQFLNILELTEKKKMGQGGPIWNYSHDLTMMDQNGVAPVENVGMCIGYL